MALDLRDFQQLIERMYSHKDRERGSAGTFLWMVEEIGELCGQARGGRRRARPVRLAEGTGSG